MAMQLLQAGAAFALGRMANSLLTRRPQRDGYSRELLGLPVGNTDSGAPRVWAIGQVVRVPAQVMWQQRKTRAANASPKKGGGLSVQHVTFDCAFLLNDRPSSRLLQFITNDQLLLWDTRNLVSVRTSGMTASESSGQLVLTMDSLQEDDFADVFKVGDVVQLQDWVIASGAPDINAGYFKVAAVTGHTVSESTLTLDVYSGQSLTGLDADAGTPFSPAAVIRVDDRIVSHNVTRDNTHPNFTFIDTSSSGYDPRDIFVPGELVEFVGNWSPNGSNYTVGDISADGFWLTQAWTAGAGTAGTSTNAGVIQSMNPRTTAAGYFPTSFDPTAHFFLGTETQGESSIITAYEGVGKVGGFRGACYQVFDDLDVTNWGGALPPATEAVIAVDVRMDWATAIAAVAERGGIPSVDIDTDGVTARPFLGYYVRGPVSGVQALQPLLLAGQIATQESNGRLRFFDIENADTVAVQNGTAFSDFGAVVNTAPIEKWQWEDRDERDFPTSIGIRFQDPDRGYGLNYEFYGRRFPSSAEAEENRQELDFSTLALKRKTARNLCATMARRARINGRMVRFTLTANYIDVLENDLLTWTDDNSNDWLARVVKRAIGANFLVEIEAVLEVSSMAVTGSPVQSNTTNPSQVLPQPSQIQGFAFEAPPVRDDWGLAPGIHVAACGSAGSSWAGATIYMSQDSGSTFVAVGRIESEHPIGFLTSALAAGTPSETHGSATLTWDTTSTFDVEFHSLGEVPITTLTESHVADGWNWFAILDANDQVAEVVGARDVTVNSTYNLTFDHLLRGLRGTFQGANAGHSNGAKVVALSPISYELTGKFVNLAGVSTPTGLQFKVVPAGEDPLNVTAQSLTQRRRNVEPFAIRDFTRTHDSSNNDQVFEWTHRTRANLPPGQVGPYQLDESREEYILEIYNPAGTSVVRTINFLAPQGSNTIRDRTYTYTSADQTTDGYTPGSNPGIWIDIRQVGDYATGPSVKQQP